MQFGELTRAIVLAQCVEPLIDKEYCSSPKNRGDPGKTYVDFVISGANTVPYFIELEKRLHKNGGQPRVFYDLVFESVVASERNRNGKTINLGLMEALFPTAIARFMSKDSRETLRKVKGVLKNTTKEDVVWLQKTRKFAWGKSSKPEKRSFPIVDAENVYEYYSKIIPIIEERGLRNHHFYNELLGNMDMTRRILKALEKGPVFESVSRVHSELIKEKDLAKSPGIVADFVAVAIFLYIMDNPEKEINWV